MLRMSRHFLVKKNRHESENEYHRISNTRHPIPVIRVLTKSGLTNSGLPVVSHPCREVESTGVRRSME